MRKTVTAQKGDAQGEKEKPLLSHHVMREIKKAVETPPPIDPVSYCVNGKETNTYQLQLDEGNAAFYIGKVFPVSWRSKTNKILGRKTKEHLYTPEFLETILTVLNQYHNIWKKCPPIIVGRSLSEIFNGQEDVKDSLSLEETRTMINKILRKKLNILPGYIEIYEMEEDPLNTRLFSVLRNPKNQTRGQIDMAKVFENYSPSLNAQSDSYDIACILHHAVKEHEQLKKIMESTIPNKEERSEEEIERMKYYGMTEIAIRLSAILHGRFIHGGAERQAVYDDIILKIVQGKFFLTEMIPGLCELFEGKDFRTLHINNKVNTAQLKSDQLIARIRVLTSLLLMGAITLPTVYGVHKIREKHRTYQQDAIIKKVTPEFMGKFPSPDLYDLQDHDVEGRIKGSLMNVKNILMVRYGLSQDQADALDSSIIDFMRRNRSNSKFYCIVSWAGKFAEIGVDAFIDENKISLLDKGIKVEAPYSNFGTYQTLLYDTLSSHDNVQVSEEGITVNGKRCSGRMVEAPHNRFYTLSMGGGNEPYSVEYLGDIFDQLSVYTQYEVFLVQVQGKQYIVSRLKNMKNECSTETVKQAIPSYITSMRIHSFGPFFEKCFGYFPYSPLMPQYDFRIDPKDMNLSVLGQYKDPVTQDSYTIAMYYYFSGKDQNKIVLVRKDGTDTKFTSQSAIDFQNMIGLGGNG